MATELDTPRLSALLAGFSGKRILVIGDLMLDEFIWGKVSRISPEAPVPVVNVTGESYYPGGAANVARNLREFSDQISLMGITGSDAHGRRLLELLDRAGIDTSAVQQDGAAETTVKTRIIARHQQVVRVDRERPAVPDLARAEADLDRCIPGVEAVLVADYGKGFITQPLANAISRSVRQHGKILTVDPHPHTSISWQNATTVKPNRAEAFLAAGMQPSDSPDAAIEAGTRLLARWNCGSLLLTLGEQGMLLLERGQPPYQIPTRAKDVFDVSGAGDTAIAVFTLSLCAGGTPVEAAELANRASGIVVGKLGTATVTTAELQAEL